jgi:hypothetical protein
MKPTSWSEILIACIFFWCGARLTWDVLRSAMIHVKWHSLSRLCAFPYGDAPFSTRFRYWIAPGTVACYFVELFVSIPIGAVCWAMKGLNWILKHVQPG